MLVLTRKINETIVIGKDIRVTMTAIRSHQVRLAIDAPPDVHIIRQELLPPSPAGEPAQGHDPGPSPRTGPYRSRRRGVRPGR